MKLWMATLIFLGATSAFGARGIEDLYSALETEEKALPAPKTQLKYEKSVGGLICVRVRDVWNGEQFACHLAFSRVDSAAIYEALNVEEVALPAFRTEFKYLKEVGGLRCLRTRHILRGESIDCSLSL